MQNLSESGSDVDKVRPPRLAVDPNGNAVFAWSRFGGTHFRVQTRTRSNASVLSAVQNLSTEWQGAFDPDVGVDADGDAVFAWLRDYGDAGSNTRVQARVRSATGVLSAVQNLSESGYDASDPRVAVDPNGNAIFAWFATMRWGAPPSRRGRAAPRAS